jgi:hypothetical protein
MLNKCELCYYDADGEEKKGGYRAQLRSKQVLIMVPWFDVLCL